MQWQIPENLIAEYLVSPALRDSEYHQLLDIVAQFCDRFSLLWGIP